MRIGGRCCKNDLSAGTAGKGQIERLLPSGLNGRYRFLKRSAPATAQTAKPIPIPTATRASTIPRIVSPIFSAAVGGLAPGGAPPAAWMLGKARPWAEKA